MSSVKNVLGSAIDEVLRDLSDTESHLSVTTSRVTELEAEITIMKKVIDRYKINMMELKVDNRLLTIKNMSLEIEKKNSKTRALELEHDMEKGEGEH
jgi:hypothetical protein